MDNYPHDDFPDKPGYLGNKLKNLIFDSQRFIGSKLTKKMQFLIEGENINQKEIQFLNVA
mgnify:CR=1 FL=1